MTTSSGSNREIVPEEKWIIPKNTKAGCLTLIGPVYRDRNKHRDGRQFGTFLCDCGSRADLDCSSVKRNHTKTCGCRLVIRKGTIAKNGMKVCSNSLCVFKGVEQSVDSFSPSERTKDRLFSMCKTCVNRGLFLRRHGVPFEFFEQCKDSQKDKCDFCGKLLDEQVNKLVPVQDHCHQTGQLRGVVHSICNLLIGKFENSLDLFPRSSFPMLDNYLTKWEERYNNSDDQHLLATAR